MKNLNKTFSVIGAIALIIMDIWVISGNLNVSDGEVFNNLMWNMVPAGLLLGVTSLCTTYDVSAKKPASIISLVVFALMAVIRAFALGVNVYDRLTLPNPDAMGYLEYVKVAELIGYMLLMVAAVLFVIYLLKGTLRKITLIFSGVSFAVIVGSWVVNLYNLISEALFYDAGFGTILSVFVSDGLVWSLILMLAYMMVFGGQLKVFETKNKD